MDDTFRLGRVLGLRVGLNWTLLIALALVTWTLATEFLPAEVAGRTQAEYWAAGLAAAVLFILSVLAHELGHAVVARRRGVRVEGITLWLFGGVARLRDEAPTPGSEALIAGAGPLVSAILAGTLAGFVWLLPDSITGYTLLGATVAGWLALANVTVLVFNLAPAFPLDGGRLLRAAIWAITNDRQRATRIASIAGRVLGFGIIGGGLILFFVQLDVTGIWLAVLGWFIQMTARTEARGSSVRGALEKYTVGELMTPDPVTVPGWITVEEFLRSYAFAHNLSAYPLRRFEGGLEGMVTVSRVGAVPHERRRSTRLADAGWPVEEVTRAGRGERVIDVLERMRAAGEGRVLVFDGDSLVGMLGPGELARALRGAGVTP